jgi:prepilin-type N-terminal cleavage/methylation domain-containing protein
MVRNNRGVTLVELMIALVILLIVFMGLIQATMYSMQSSMKNVLRDEAVRITSDRLARLKSAAFTDALLTSTGGATVDDDLNAVTAGVQSWSTMNVRNAVVPFHFQKIVDDIDTNHKRISLSTSWVWQGENFSHTLVVTRGR